MLKESTTMQVAADLAIPLEEAIHSNSDDVLNAAAADPSLTLDLALALLKRRDLPAQIVEQLGKNSSLMKSRKLKLALVEHPRTPRHLSLPMVPSVHIRSDEGGADARSSRRHQDRRGRSAR